MQVSRGKVKSQEGRERRAGWEVQVPTGNWFPGHPGVRGGFYNSRATVIFIETVVHDCQCLNGLNVGQDSKESRPIKTSTKKGLTLPCWMDENKKGVLFQ